MLDGGTGVRPDKMESSFTIMPYMLEAWEIPIIADAIHEAMTKPGHYENPVIPTGATQIGGKWAVSLKYTRGTAEQTFDLQQSGSDLKGKQVGAIYQADLTGSIHGNDLKLHARMPVSGHEVIWDFTGTVQGNTASGTVALGEYGMAEWKAVRA
jgi:hypothetical protein